MNKNKSKKGFKMTTIYVNTDEELKDAINKYKNNKDIKIVDERPNQKGEDPEISRHWYEYNEELHMARDNQKSKDDYQESLDLSNQGNE